MFYCSSLQHGAKYGRFGRVCLLSHNFHSMMMMIRFFCVLLHTTKLYTSLSFFGCYSTTPRFLPSSQLHARYYFQHKSTSKASFTFINCQETTIHTNNIQQTMISISKVMSQAVWPTLERDLALQIQQQWGHVVLWMKAAPPPRGGWNKGAKPAKNGSRMIHQPKPAQPRRFQFNPQKTSQEQWREFCRMGSGLFVITQVLSLSFIITSTTWRLFDPAIVQCFCFTFVDHLARRARRAKMPEREHHKTYELRMAGGNENRYAFATRSLITFVVRKALSCLDALLARC